MAEIPSAGPRRTRWLLTTRLGSRGCLKQNLANQQEEEEAGREPRRRPLVAVAQVDLMRAGVSVSVWAFGSVLLAVGVTSERHGGVDGMAKFV